MVFNVLAWQLANYVTVMSESNSNFIEIAFRFCMFEMYPIECAIS